MRPVEGHEQEQTKQDIAVFTESAAVKVAFILLGISTPSPIIGPSGADTKIRYV